MCDFLTGADFGCEWMTEVGVRLGQGGNGRDLVGTRDHGQEERRRSERAESPGFRTLSRPAAERILPFREHNGGDLPELPARRYHCHW